MYYCKQVAYLWLEGSYNSRMTVIEVVLYRAYICPLTKSLFVLPLRSTYWLLLTGKSLGLLVRIVPVSVRTSLLPACAPLQYNMLPTYDFIYIYEAAKLKWFFELSRCWIGRCCYKQLENQSQFHGFSLLVFALSASIKFQDGNLARTSSHCLPSIKQKKTNYLQISRSLGWNRPYPGLPVRFPWQARFFHHTQASSPAFL